MTEKAAKILQKMKFRKLFPRRGPEPASESGSTAGDDQGMTVLNESNDLQTDYEEYVKSLGPRWI